MVRTVVNGVHKGSGLIGQKAFHTGMNAIHARFVGQIPRHNALVGDHYRNKIALVEPVNCFGSPGNEFHFVWTFN